MSEFAHQPKPQVSEQITLYSGPLSMFGAKAQIALHEKGLPFELVMVPFDMERLYEPRHSDVVRVNPKRQVPVLLHGDVEIFDSTQIFEYLEDLTPAPPLWPLSIAARAKARLLELQSDEVYFPSIIRLMGLQKVLDGADANAMRTAAGAFYGRMNSLLERAEHLAGEFSYADIAFYVAQLFGDRMGAPIGTEHVELTAWRQRMGRRPAVRAVVGPMATYLEANHRRVPTWLSDVGTG